MSNHPTKSNDNEKGSFAFSSSANMTHVILFYKYHPLSRDWTIMEDYRMALQCLSESLQLKGRILVGCSETEGLNGTLSGSHEHVLAFTQALLQDKDHLTNQESTFSANIQTAIQDFGRKSRTFFERIQQPELKMDTPLDFKWSTASQGELFPDLCIKLVKELIGSGGVMLDIPVAETSQGYLTPQQWHEELQKQSNNNSNTQNDTLLIDCRNTKEYQIGHFPGALDPRTVSYSQFATWVQHNRALLHNKKKILMYCTGGIRCEKASAYIRRQLPQSTRDEEVTVQHLQGGIHKYLEEYGQDGLWQGKNFVFDARQASSAEETRLGKNGAQNETENSEDTTLETNNSIVGKCFYCCTPYDTFAAHCVCAVCREPVLICEACQSSRVEYHCQQHFTWKDCYFCQLQAFSTSELQDQRVRLQAELGKIAVGRRFRQQRKTLSKQIARVNTRLEELEQCSTMDVDSPNNVQSTCRSCGRLGCDGTCWGFFGLKRKEILEQSDGKACQNSSNPVRQAVDTKTVIPPNAKKPRRGVSANELVALNYHQPPSCFQHDTSQNTIRCPPCVTRVVQSNVKAKWCGKSVLQVLQTEFFSTFESLDSAGSSPSQSLSSSGYLYSCLEHGLIKLNHQSISPTEACHVKLKSGDLLGRVVHWHEPPVHAPHNIQVTKVCLPQSVLKDHGLSDLDAMVYVCNKPSSVPVHPAGPYLANTLTVMVEAQEKLPSCSLKPLHRTDRATSGLTLLATSSCVAKLVHRSLAEGKVQKLYLAQVSGHFPHSQAQVEALEVKPDLCKVAWHETSQSVRVEAPIHTPDPTTGVRLISDKGKPAQSIFRLLSYNSSDDTSIVACFPVTGRNHQLRVHLQALQCPVLGDLQYNGRLDSEFTTSRETVLRILKSCTHPEQETFTESLMPDLEMRDVQSARKACPSCSDDSNPCFTRAQMLQGGHGICLHALSYRLSFLGKKHQVNSSTDVEFSAELPKWADSLDDVSQQSMREIWQSQDP